nr:hypothetical protein CFP56_16501 [Quercus suber]POF04890.1 hypothetical protein CFP56_73851 [Quercus suber]
MYGPAWRKAEEVNCWDTVLLVPMLRSEGLLPGSSIARGGVTTVWSDHRARIHESTSMIQRPRELERNGMDCHDTDSSSLATTINPSE